MATKKYGWKFDLEEYLMTKDVKEDFAAKVKPIQTFYMADVARLIVEERTEYRVDTIVNITKLVEAKIRQLVCGNNNVVTDNVQYLPGILDVTGSKIRSVNANGTGLGSLTLVNTTDQSVAATITLLAINDPKQLMFSVSADLADGEYELTFETWFSTNSTQLKQSRTLTYAIPLVVGAMGGGGEDDRPVFE